MTVHGRILVFIIAGYLSGAGWISEEVKTMLINDPEIASYVQSVLAGAVIGIGYLWRWIAKKRGWST